MNKKQELQQIIQAHYDELTYLYGLYKVKSPPSYESLQLASAKHGPRFRRQVEAIVSGNVNANYDPDDPFDYNEPDIEWDPVVGLDGDPIVADDGGGFNFDEWASGLIKIGKSGINLWQKYKDVKNYDPNKPDQPQGPPPGYYDQPTNAGISQQTMLIGGGLLALIIIVLLFKK